MGRRTLLLISALLVAALGTALIWLYVRGADQRALDGQAAVTVWVTKAPAQAGTAAESLFTEQYVTQQRVAQPLAVGALASADEVKGLVAAVPIPAGVMLTRTMFTGKESAPLPIKIDKGNVAVSVQMGDPQRVAGFVGQGSKVAIFVTLTKTDTAGSAKGASGAAASSSVTKLVLDSVKVLTTGSTATQPVSRTTADGQTVTQNLPQSIVTVQLSPDDAAKLIQAQASGALYFALLNDGDSGQTKRYPEGVTTGDL